MAKFITLREEFESETSEHPFTDQKYIEWLERIVKLQRVVKNHSISDVLERSKQLQSCKYVKKVGESCTLNNNCKYPNCN